MKCPECGVVDITIEIVIEDGLEWTHFSCEVFGCYWMGAECKMVIYRCDHPACVKDALFTVIYSPEQEKVMVCEEHVGWLANFAPRNGRCLDIAIYDGEWTI